MNECFTISKRFSLPIRERESRFTQNSLYRLAPGVNGLITFLRHRLLQKGGVCVGYKNFQVGQIVGKAKSLPLLRHGRLIPNSQTLKISVTNTFFRNISISDEDESDTALTSECGSMSFHRKPFGRQTFGRPPSRYVD
jgi:hypothetical protein